MSKILIIEDEESIAELERDYLEISSYDVTICNDGEKGLKEALDNEYDLYILDLMLPLIDGIDVLKAMRQVSRVPVIMLSAKGETIDKILGLELGADDYIVKPFEPKELLARLRAVLRRFDASENKVAKVTFDKLSIDMTKYELIVDGKKMDIPPKELELLHYLCSHPNKVFTRDQLLDEVWGYEFFGDSRTVDVHVKRLREKIEGISNQWCLKTVWGVGYKFEVKNG